MAKTLYSVTMSLDGYIAGPGGDMSWLTPYVGTPSKTADDLVGQIGSLLVGNRTWGGDDPNKGTENEGAFGGAWHGPQFVLTHRPPAEPVEDTVFLDDLTEAIARAREAAGDRYVNILGADVARQVLEAGELDEILTFVAPVLLGDGTPLFAHPGGTEVRLERIRPDEMWFRVL